jgi:hypothetical protein
MNGGGGGGIGSGCVLNYEQHPSWALLGSSFVSFFMFLLYFDIFYTCSTDTLVLFTFAEQESEILMNRYG